MATLYTPEPKTQGLDWLAGMVQNSQQLWQQERNLQQEAQRLQVAKQQQQAQTEQFWATQARLKDQEDFQNRKFLYSMKNDERNFAWGKVKDERNYGLDERRVTTGENQEKRLAADQAYTQSPDSPDYQWRRAATVNAQVNTAETLQKMREADKPSRWGSTPNPAGDLPTGPGEGASSALFESTGSVDVPGVITTPSGKKLEIYASSYDKKGYPTSYTPREVKPVMVDEEKQRNVDSDNLATLTKARRPIPKPPTPPLGATPEQIAAQNKAYGDQLKDVEEYNAPLNQQIYETTQRLNFRDSRERMKNTPLEKVEITEAFQNVAPPVMEAYSRRDPIALENLRVQVKPLADAGDPSAKRVLEYMDKIKGGKPAEKGLRTGATFWNTP